MPSQELPEDVVRLINEIGGVSSDVTEVIPEDRWLTKPGHEDPPMLFRMGMNHPARIYWEPKLVAVARYAVRASTDNGADFNFNPEAMVQNFVIGMLGYYTNDGLSQVVD